MKSPQSLYKLFLLNFLKFLLPIGIFFAFTFFNFRSDIIDLESEYLLRTGEKLVDFLSHDEDLLDNQYLGNDYIILIMDRKGQLLSSNMKMKDIININTFKELKTQLGNIQDIGNYLIYVNTFPCKTSICKAIVALPKSRIERRINVLLLSSMFATFITSILIAFLSVLDIRKYLHEYELYSKELKKVALYLSHEIKTPLSIILMNAPYVQADNEIKSAIERAIRRIIKLTKNLKVLSDMDLKPHRLTLINVKGLINELVEFYRPHLYSKHLSINVDGVPKAAVLSDYELLYTLFLNLLDNAVKYAKENTEIQVMGELQDNKLRVSISNVAEGERHLNMDDESYGLGLTIVDEIAKRLAVNLSFKRDVQLFIAVVEMQVAEGR